MLFKWFDARAAVDFGITLANFYMERIPPAIPNSKKSIEKQQEVVKKMILRMQAFSSEHQLNIYTKAQLGNKFKWTLIQAGYEPKYVDKLTQILMAY